MTQELDIEALKLGRILYVDPGDNTGWGVGRGFKLLAAGQIKLWEFAMEVWGALQDPNDPHASYLNGDHFTRVDVLPEENLGPICAIVCEDFRIYPWKAKDLKFDRVRTARLIGALTFMAKLHSIPFVLQPASIKKAAQSAGAEELYYKPLRENRHMNDAIQHYTFFTQTTLRGIEVQVPDGEPDMVG